ncbi:pentapeptide repeat-containing protein [Neisseria montereyensis]|uniref:Pentapeptide repeat-containing protein n=1 Tax=Neisseria montereyensis TaxID=2973938 RepID=A0ABT2FEE7_9NEIS|nr:pentapeptide repeat-containing protein [Neisseria montereyensis]MCS4533898.1 pentapeptide repeat-containing protein [Neisseria montereyensis]
MATNKGETKKTKKKGFDWLKLKREQLNQKPRGKLVFLTAILEIEVLYFLWRYGLPILKEDPFWADVLKGSGVWTFLVLLLSAPIAFFLWLFRDENTVHQIENQRKDVNLKEFHKIAEWVSGLHLVEDKITEKTKPSEQPNNETAAAESEQTVSEIPLNIENAREYGQAGAKRHLPSHSREDGAVGLQVAAVYMLKPFYCGEHGDDFRKPALNLLTAVWLALFKQVEKNKTCAKKLSKSPLGIALTEVLLADGGEHLRYHSEVFPNLYLPYLDLHLPGLDKKVFGLFKDMDCTGIQLQGSNLIRSDLSGSKLIMSDLSGSNLSRSDLSGSNLSGSYLIETNLSGANLNESYLFGSDLRWSNLNGSDLGWSNLSKSDFRGSNLIGSNLEGVNLIGSSLDGTDLREANLSSSDLREANLRGSNLRGANLLDTQGLLTCKHMNEIQDWEGVLIRLEDAKAIKNKFELFNMDCLLVIDQIDKIYKMKRSVGEQFLLKEIYFQFTNKLSDYSVKHTLRILEETQNQVLKEFQELNPNWEVTIVNPE